MKLAKNIEEYAYNPLDREEWKELRNFISGAHPQDDYTRFGGSEVGTIMDLSEWKGPHALFMERIGLKVPKDEMNLFQYRGIMLEEDIAQKYWRYLNPANDDPEEMMARGITQKTVREPVDVSATFFNPDYPYLFANIDYAFEESEHSPAGVLEVKSIYGTALNKWKGGIPPQYVVQLQTYLLVTGLEYGEVFLLADALTPYRFPFQKNEKIQNDILEATEDMACRILDAREEINTMDDPTDNDALWDIVYKHEPPISDEPTYLEFLKDPIHPDRPNTVDGEAHPELKEAVIRYSNIKEAVISHDEPLKKEEIIIRKAFHDLKAEKITFKEGAISWKSKFYVPYKKFVTNKV